MKPTFKNSTVIIILLLSFVTCRQPKHQTEPVVGSINDSIGQLMTQSKKAPLVQARVLLQNAIDLAKQYQKDTLELKAISRLAILEYRAKKLEQYNTYSHQLLIRAKQVKDTIYIARGHSYLGSYFSRINTNDSAYYYFNEAKTFYDHLRDSLKIASMMLNMATIETRVGDYYGSEKTTINALSYLRHTTKPKTIRGLYNNLGILSYESEQYKDALYWYKLALDITVDIKGKAVILNNIGLIHRDTKSYTTAISYFKKALTLNLEAYEPIKAMVLDNLGYVYMLEGNPEGLKIMEDALLMRHRINSPRGKVVSQLHLGQYYVQQQDSIQAEELLTAALQQAKTIKDSKNQLKLLKVLYERLPNQNYTTQYISLKDSINEAERNYKHQFAKIRYRTKQKEDDYDILEAQYQKQTETLKIEKLKKIWFAILFGIALLFIGAILYFYRQRKKIHQQQLLIEKLEAKAEEKQALSVQLHDTIASDILLGLQYSEKLKERFGGKEFNMLITIFERAYDKARRISQDLNQVYFHKAPFKQKITNLCVEYGFHNDLGIDLQGIEAIDWDRVNNTIKVSIYELLQEAFTNILKHAKASKVKLLFYTQAQTIDIEISDNGIGIDASKTKKGIGLLNMQERISDISGTLTISANTPKGTVLKLTIPILNSNA